jgi:hypothetical protein
MPVTAKSALTDACFAVRRYRYIPDTVTVDDMTIPVDVWDTLQEFEARKGGDCDGHASWTIEHAFRWGSSGTFYFVVGEVLQRSGVWAGHAWVELIEDGTCWWADPTWGELPTSPQALGYPETRRPRNRWRYAGEGQFDQEEIYTTP